MGSETERKLCHVRAFVTMWREDFRNSHGKGMESHFISRTQPSTKRRTKFRDHRTMTGTALRDSKTNIEEKTAREDEREERCEG